MRVGAICTDIPKYDVFLSICGCSEFAPLSVQIANWEYDFAGVAGTEVHGVRVHTTAHHTAHAELALRYRRLPARARVRLRFLRSLPTYQR